MDELKQSSTIIIENHVNQVKLKNFRKKDMDLFLVICNAFKDTNDYTVKIKYDDILKLADYKKLSLNTFHQTLKDLDLKDTFTNLKITVDTEEEYYSAKFITTFRANKQKKILTVTMNPDFVDFFNVFNQYTKIDLSIHTALQSKYAAVLYRMLSQYSKTHWWKVSIADFRDIFDVPEKYDSRKILQKIIEPAIEELKPYMTITFNSIKAKKRGQPVIGYEFRYTSKTVTDKKESEQLSGQIEFADTTGFDEIVMDMQETTSHSDIDYIIDLIDSYNLGIGSKSTINIAKKAYELNRNEKYIRGAIEVAKSQKCNNLGGKIMKFIIDGYADSVKREKKTGFNNFESRKYNYDDLEKKLLG